MENSKFTIQLASPSVDDFLRLRCVVSWESIDNKVVQTSLANSLFHVTIYDGKALIGMGRIVGDGAIYFYIQDIVVAPDYQQCGIGAMLMEQIEHYLSSTAQKGAMIGLLAAKGKEPFYARYGYMQRPNNSLGHGMCRFV